MSVDVLTLGDPRVLYLVAGRDVSDRKLWFTARYERDDEDAVIAKTSDPDEGIVVTDGVGGLATVSILPDDWADFDTDHRTLLWGLQVKSADDEDVPGATILSGIYYIQQVVRPDA